jgi:hypothetical protein
VPQQQAIPAWLVLNAANDTAASGMSDQYTGFPYNAGGLNLGDYFDLTSAEAYRNCKPSVGILYCGRYRRIQVDSGATAANVKTGTIGLLASQAAASQDIGNIGGALPVSMNVVTSYDKSLGGATGVRPVVFLNSITPGNFGYVQELGIASVLAQATLTATTPAIGDVIVSAASGLVNDPTQSGNITYTIFQTILGLAYDIPANGKLFRILLDGLPIVQD